MRQILMLCAMVLALTGIAPGAHAAPGQAQAPLILAVNPYISAAEIRQRFAPLAGLLTRTLGRPVEVRVGRSYLEHIQAIGEDRVDLAYVGPASYVHLIRSYGPRPVLARQAVDGKSMQASMIFVRSDSPVRTLADLRGRRVAYADPDSATGYLLASAALRKAGIDRRALAEQRFLNSQSNVVLSVLAGDFDAGSVKDDIFTEYAGRGLRVLQDLPKVPEFTFVASPRLPSATRETLRHALLHLADSPEGRGALAAIRSDLSGMVSAPDSDYDGLRRLLEHFPPGER